MNLSSSYLYDRLPLLHALSTIFLGVTLVLWLGIKGFQFVTRRYGRFAVEAIFLNGNNELLLIRHPFHNCLLAPSGRLRIWQPPNEALAEVLRREAGIVDFELHPVFHNKGSMVTDRVQDIPRPYAVQIEHRRQRGLVGSHYDFLYVCRFRGGDQPLKSIADYHPRWMSIAEIRALGKDERPFDDLIIRYEEVLAVLNDNKLQPHLESELLP